MVNEVSGRKSTARAKLEAASQEERIWKQHLENLLGKPQKVMVEPITKIINNQLDFKLEQFTRELNFVLRKIKNRKVAGFDEISPEVWKIQEFDNTLHCHVSPEHNRQMDKGIHPPFPQKG